MNSQQLKQQALNLLGRREHCRFEMETKLQRSCQDKRLIKNVLDDLEQQGLLSNARFVEAYVHHRSQRGFGPLRIQQELQCRKIDDTLIRQYVYHNGIDWFQYALSVQTKKFGKTMATDHLNQMKQRRYLQYRGFTLDHIKQTLAIE